MQTNGDLPQGRGRKAILAKAWDVSRSYIGQLVKKGMPLDSFRTIAEATQWREVNAMKRASPMSKPAAQVRAARKSAAPAEQPEGAQAPQAEEKEPDGSLESALAATVRIANKAEQLVMEAMRSQRLPEIPPLLSIHNKAIDARFEAERQFREEMEKRGMLINRNAGTELWRKGFNVIVQKLKRIPQNKAQLCNPQAPLVAFGILEDAVNEILEAAQKVYAEFDVKSAA